MREVATERAVPACGLAGCTLPWLDHFTRAGKQRATLSDHFPADLNAAMASARLIMSKRKKSGSAGTTA